MRLCAVVALTKGSVCTAHLWVIRRVCDLINWCNFNDFKKVKLGCWVFFTLHNENVLKALVIGTTVQHV